MALASLKCRIERLEAKHKTDANRVVGVIGSRFGHMIVDPDKPGHLKWAEPPGGFAEYARNQQNALQAELRTIFADMTDNMPKTKAERLPIIVGNDALAPIPDGKRRARYIEINGVEIDTLALRKN